MPVCLSNLIDLTWSILSHLWDVAGHFFQKLWTFRACECFCWRTHLKAIYSELFRDLSTAFLFICSLFRKLSIFTMPRENARTRKREFHSNQFTKNAKKNRVSDEDKTDGKPSTSSNNMSASVRKIGKRSSTITEGCAEGQSSKLTGYGFIDMDILGELFQQIVCQECGGSSHVLEDKPTERKGSASHLRVRCEKCGWVYTFYTSKRIPHGFDVNRRLVYAMRSIGQGHSSIERFCAHMNMPAPLGYTAYRDNNIALAKAAKSVATKSMLDAAAELHKDSLDPITQCAVSCDGTWQRRGHASLNGCVTTLSIDGGKCLDFLSKVCYGCKKREREKDAAKKADLQERHKCKANYQGSAASMEVEGVKRIFNRSEQTRKLQYTEYFGDGDSKAYQEVQH